MGFRKPESAFVSFLWWRPNAGIFELMEGKVGVHVMLVYTLFSRYTKYLYSYSGFYSKKGKKEEGFFKN